MIRFLLHCRSRSNAFIVSSIDVGIHITPGCQMQRVMLNPKLKTVLPDVGKAKCIFLRSRQSCSHKLKLRVFSILMVTFRDFKYTALAVLTLKCPT